VAAHSLLRHMDAHIVKKVAAGTDQPDAKVELLPIDVHYQDLIDFLVTRQRLPKDWLQRVQAIQAKSIEAMKSTPPHAIKAAEQTSGSHMEVGYSKAIAIRNALAATCERTLFGGLQGPAATWDKIVQAYETKSVYLGESAQSLVQLISYDIPAYKKQHARLDQQVAEAERKHTESLKSASQSAAAFECECLKLGFHHRSPIRSSLKDLSIEIPTILQSAMAGLQSEDLARAASYYSDFVSFAHHGVASDVLPILREVLAGETTFPSHLADKTAEDTSPVLDVDWDIGVGQAEPTLDLDIDWGIGSAAGGGGEEVAAPAEISWDFDLEPSADATNEQGAAQDVAEFGIVMEEAPALEVNWDIAIGHPQLDAEAAIPVIQDQGHNTSSSSSSVVKRLELDPEYRNK
jgi:hypothetical protein